MLPSSPLCWSTALPWALGEKVCLPTASLLPPPSPEPWTLPAPESPCFLHILLQLSVKATGARMESPTTTTAPETCLTQTWPTMAPCLFLVLVFPCPTGTYHQGELCPASMVTTALTASTVGAASLSLQYSLATTQQLWTCMAGLFLQTEPDQPGRGL